MMAATSGRIKEDKRVLDKTLTEFQLATSTELDFVARLHAQNVQKHAESVGSMAENARSLQELVIAQNHKAQAEKAKVDCLQKEIRSMDIQKENLPKTVRDLEAEEQKKQMLVAQKKIELAEAEKKKTQMINEITKGVLFFKERLGLEFVTNDGTLKMIFTHIDPKNPYREFVAVVHVDEQNQYNVPVCEPQLAALPEMIVQLNKTTNFSWFVQALRRAFKQMACA